MNTKHHNAGQIDRSFRNVSELIVIILKIYPNSPSRNLCDVDSRWSHYCGLVERGGIRINSMNDITFIEKELWGIIVGVAVIGVEKQ